MTYLERYKNGEYEQVWEELLQLGSQVREEPIYSDALAVARETMLRVRQDIEILIGRLIRLGFVFGYDHLLLGPLAHMGASFDSDIYGDTFSCYELLCWVKNQPPVFLIASMMKDITEVEVERYVVLPRPQTMLAILENEFGPVPLAVQAWYTEIGAVNFYGYCAKWNEFIRSFRPTTPPF